MAAKKQASIGWLVSSNRNCKRNKSVVHEEKFFRKMHSDSPCRPQWAINGFGFHVNWMAYVV